MLSAPPSWWTAALFLLGACRSLAPPVILEAQADPPEQARARYPVGAEEVEVETDEGNRLRGLFVPAEAGAPVVLHLLDSGMSWAGDMVDLGELSAQLLDLGWSSLVFDYSGVGTSSGERSVDHLAADALAAWRVALRLAGGDPGRVIVRGISTGAIAAALLLEARARPAATIWIAPVFPATVAARFARASASPLMGLLARALFRPVAEIELEEAVARSGVPVLVLASDEDELSSRAERARLERAALGADGRFERVDGKHMVLAARARWLYSAELPLYRRFHEPEAAPRLERVLAALPPEIAVRFPEGSAARSRLMALAGWQRESPATWTAAAALACADAEQAARILWLMRRRSYPELPFDELVAVLSPSDPAGELPISAVEDCSLPMDIAQRYDVFFLWLGPEWIVSQAWNRGAFPSLSFAVRVPGGLSAGVRCEPKKLWESLRARVRSDEDAVRQYVRIVLRGVRVPERLVPESVGCGRIEYFYKEEGLWIPLDLARPEQSAALPSTRAAGARPGSAPTEHLPARSPRLSPQLSQNWK